jgi:hypothetical protein
MKKRKVWFKKAGKGLRMRLLRLNEKLLKSRLVYRESMSRTLQDSKQATNEVPKALSGFPGKPELASSSQKTFKHCKN